MAQTFILQNRSNYQIVTQEQVVIIVIFFSVFVVFYLFCDWFLALSHMCAECTKENSSPGHQTTTYCTRTIVDELIKTAFKYCK